ncbi:MAG: bifunctional transcriptional activator/DNA repair enzyme AdaA [Phycisphaerales bacterium]
MYDAVVRRDTSFVGVFFLGVRTTGVFCRPGCGAKVPLLKNIVFFSGAKDALLAGYRPCLRCRPMDPPGARPAWVDRLIAAVEGSGTEQQSSTIATRSETRARRPTVAALPHRLSAAHLRAMGIHPATAARWFKTNYGMTFQAYQRARRVGRALARLQSGGSMTSAATVAAYESESGLREAFESLFGEPARDAVRAGAAPLCARWLPSPLGPLLAVASNEALMFLEFVDRRALEAQISTLRRRAARPIVPGDNAILRTLDRQLSEYLGGARREFTVPLDAPGTTFQQRVWKELRAIPCGQTRSYLDVARAIGQPTATRAVARANGDNRIAILIPCHRVIGSDGTLTGYGGGLWRKEWLLRHEGAWLAPASERTLTPAERGPAPQGTSKSARVTRGA